MKLRDIKQLIHTLPPGELIKLDAWLQKLVKAAGPKRNASSVTGRELVERRQAGHMSYRLELVRCGKVNCRCSGGELHGPYWYAYWTEGRRTRSRYLGKELPEQQWAS
jgi:hypothetical protein